MQIGHNLSHIKIPIKKQHTTKEILRIRKSDQPKSKPKEKKNGGQQSLNRNKKEEKLLIKTGRYANTLLHL